MKRLRVREIKALSGQPPSGGCVLKLSINNRVIRTFDSAAFGRLCVETPLMALPPNLQVISRLRAAVC